MSNQIDQIIAEAEGRAANVPAVQTTQTTAVQTQAARPPSLDDLSNSSMIVDTFLKVSEDGLKLSDGTENALLENLKVSIDMSEVIATTVIKYGNPAIYHKTFDGIMCADGATSWSEALERGARNNASPYASADIPMVLEEDVVSKKGKVIFTKGQRIGYSLSTTNKAAFAKFRKEVGAADALNSKVDVKLGYEAKTNKNNNVWGIVTFEFEGESAE